jgi:N-acetylmuramoyl-L-alanine amidase
MGVFLSIVTVLMGFSLWGGGEEADEPRGEGVTVPLAQARSNPLLALPAISGGRDARLPLVVIDPGHGGADPGAVSPASGYQEKDVTLAIARTIEAELARSGRIRVALTRADDKLLSLTDRYAIARRMGAKLFISIHADAAPSNDAARGATIYSLSETASDREAAQLARRENGGVAGADVTAGSGVNHILIDLAQRETMETSAGFARLLHREASPLIAFQPDYLRFASLIVLKAPDIPSILFESGYLTNQSDEAFLRSENGRRRIAVGVRRAIEAHFARRTDPAGSSKKTSH